MKLEFGIVISNTSQGNVIDLTLRTTTTEMLGRILRRGTSLFLGLKLVLYSKFRGRNFFKEGRM